MKITVFDIETYRELFVFCSITYDWDTEQELDRLSIYSGDDHAVDDSIMGRIEDVFESSDYIVSFNGLKFDLPVLAKAKSDIAKLGRTTSGYIYVDGNDIIANPGLSGRRIHYYVKDWNAKHFDLLNNCLLDKSLKQWEMFCNLPIRELPYDPDARLSAEQKREIIDYCMHDVWATAQVFWKCGSGKKPFKAKPYSFKARLDLMKLWPSHLPYRFDRTLQGLSAGIIYETLDPIPPRTNQPLTLFDINEFDVPIDVKIIIARLARGELVDESSYSGINYGKGGSHFIRKGLFKDIHCFDVESEYPRAVRNWKLLKNAVALGNWSDTMEKRFAQKALKGTAQYDPGKDFSLKTVLNSLTGGFRMKTGGSVAFDPAAGEAMCYIGQLVVSELALNAPDFENVIEVNTDSVFVVGDSNIEYAREKCKQMFDKYDMKFEEEVMDMAYFRDVNNYIIYDKDGNVVGGKGTDYADCGYKGSERAVYTELFRHLVKDHLELDWERYCWQDFIFKYHKSAAAKYASIAGQPLDHKNYYMMWTTSDCPDAVPIEFSRDQIDRKNGAIKVRFGVYAFDVADLEKYKDFIDYTQYQRDLDVNFDLWGRADLCSTFLSKEHRKGVRKGLFDPMDYIL